MSWIADIGGELTAPAERRILDERQIESAWPCDGSLLVEDGLAAAGGRLYMSAADGSMHCFAAAGAATRP